MNGISKIIQLGVLAILLLTIRSIKSTYWTSTYWILCEFSVLNGTYPTAGCHASNYYCFLSFAVIQVTDFMSTTEWGIALHCSLVYCKCLSRNACISYALAGTTNSIQLREMIRPGGTCPRRNFSCFSSSKNWSHPSSCGRPRARSLGTSYGS